MTARRRATDKLIDAVGRPAGSARDRDPRRLLQELATYQEELRIQNAELIGTRETLEEARDLYVDLYDFAPNGYLTLDAHGVILRVNLTGAAMLGRKRESVEGLPLFGFVTADDRQALLAFLRRCRSNNGQEGVAELTLKLPDGRRDVQLICKPRHDRGATSEFFTAMIDVTERKSLEAERELVAREHSALASKLLSIQDDERHRIAQDLHDNVGQHVTALRLLLDAIDRGCNDQSIRSRVMQAHSIVESLDEQLDCLTSGLRPGALDLGAVSALRQFVEEWSHTFDIDAKFRGEGVEDLRLSPQVETHVYRVVQEALNNVSKHAEARHVAVQLSREDPLIVVTISDDGKGFDLSPRARARARARRHGLGLVGMRERAQIINGTVDIQSAPGKGTTVVLKVPETSSVAPK